MPNWFKHQGQPQKVGVLLYPEFSNHCLANVIEPLRAANTLSGRTLYQWQFLTLDGGTVESSSGLPILPNKLSDMANGDFLFVMPSYAVRRYATTFNARHLREAAKHFTTMVGLDTGSWLLADAGLLDGLHATIHWDELTLFEETFEQVTVRHDRFVLDKNVMTCGGVTTAFDLVLHIIGRTHGEALRLEVAALFLHSDVSRPQKSKFKPTGSGIVDRTVAFMRVHIERPIPISAIAKQLCVTQRRMDKEFSARLGASPRTVYKRLRLLSARRYVEQSDFTIAEITVRCGYQDPSAMTRAFAREFGVTPSAIRSERNALAPDDNT